MTDSEMSVALAPTIGMSTNVSPFFSTPRSTHRTCAKTSRLRVHREAHQARVAAVSLHEGAQLRRVSLGIGRAEGGADTKRAGLRRGGHREIAQRRDGGGDLVVRIA